jgi:hypothetical protein
VLFGVVRCLLLLGVCCCLLFVVVWLCVVRVWCSGRGVSCVVCRVMCRRVSCVVCRVSCVVW